MGDFSFAAVGYDIPEPSLDMYQRQYNLPEESTKQLLRHLEQSLCSPISLACFDDKDGETHNLLCCHILYEDGAYDCNTLLSLPVPPSFEQVKELFPGASEIKRLFVEKGTVSSFNEAGKTRVKADGLQI